MYALFLSLPNYNFFSRPIFQTIPPTSYRAMCNQVVSTATSQQDALEKACMIARAYVTMARENHMSSYNIPDMCSKYFCTIR